MTAVARSTVCVPHALDLLAAQALDRGDAEAAFKLADRFCRVSAPRDAHAYLIRGEALNRLGHRQAARSDITRALLLDPEHLVGNRWLLRWGGRGQQERAAETLIKIEQNFVELKKAMSVLRAHRRRRTFGAVIALETSINGWAVWRADTPIEVTVWDEENASTASFHGDKDHPLAAFGHAVSFSITRPESRRPQHITVSAGGRTICSTFAPAHASPPIDLKPGSDAGRARPAEVTVIVPIFEDLAATKACLNCLLDELDGDETSSALLVDDATPNARIKALLRRVGEHPRVVVLTNPSNLGFAGAINRALRAIPKGDVILLNADTIPPRGFVGRLAAAAHSSPDIGLVMPLSNNGDLASYPVPQEVAPLGSSRAVGRIDRTAMAVNAGRIIDIPNGVGFCLYITRACLDKLGFLSESFGRGYFEDVELSLRARDKGFRCVCAPSIYVGHAGSKSFKSEKGALVARNSRILRSLYPKYAVEFAAFATIDPLRPSRQAIALESGEAKSGMRIIVSGNGAVGEVARRRAQDLADDQPVRLLEVRRNSAGRHVSVMDLTDQPSQPLQFHLNSVSERAALGELIAGGGGSRVELFDPARTPLALLDIFRDLKLRVDIAIADAGLLGRAEAASLLSSAQEKAGVHAWGKREGAQNSIPEPWRGFASTVESVFAMDEFGRAFGGHIFPNRNVELIGKPIGLARTRWRPTGAPNRSRSVGLLPIRIARPEFHLIRAIARRLKAVDPQLTFVVIGATLNDAALMESDGLHVTGVVKAPELETVVAHHAIARLFLCPTQPLFGHPLVRAGFECRQPLAYFDWSSGAVKPVRSDLSLDPGLSLNDLIIALANWIGSDPSEGARSSSRFQ